MSVNQIVVLGGVNTDFLVRTSTLPRPDAPRSDGEFVHSPGGKGLNQAVAAARLGASVALIGCVGQDARGDEAIAQLAAEHVAVDAVSRTSKSPTGTTVIQVDAGGRKQTAAALGANGQLRVADVSAAAGLIAQTRVLLVQLEVPLECVDCAISIARQHQVTVIFDPAPARTLSDSPIQGVEVLKPNASEAQTLTGVEVRDRESARNAARRLHTRGARNVIISLEGGTLLLSRDIQRWYPNLPVHTVDTTGAGDAFAGALAVALVEQQPMTAAVAFAHAAAALATTIVGALPSLPSRDAVRQHVSRVEIDAPQE